MSTPRLRSQMRFAKLVESSPIGKPIGYNIETPENTLKQLLTAYNIKNLTKHDLSLEINILLKEYPHLLGYFRKELIKNNLIIALKNNYIDKSIDKLINYTIKPMQKRLTMRKSKSKNKTKSKSKTNKIFGKTI